jgi:hypothetical protein
MKITKEFQWINLCCRVRRAKNRCDRAAPRSALPILQSRVGLAWPVTPHGENQFSPPNRSAAKVTG